MHPDGYAKTCSSEQLRCSSDLALMQFGSAPLTADLGGEPGGAHHALPRILKLVKTCSRLLVVIFVWSAVRCRNSRPFSDIRVLRPAASDDTLLNTRRHRYLSGTSRRHHPTIATWADLMKHFFRNRRSRMSRLRRTHEDHRGNPASEDSKEDPRLPLGLPFRAPPLPPSRPNRSRTQPQFL